MIFIFRNEESFNPYKLRVNGKLAEVSPGRFNYFQITFTDKFRVDDNAKVTPLRRAESLARLGELLLHTQAERLADAETHFREALRSSRATRLR